MDVELEHGLHDLLMNVTDSDPIVTGKIALAPVPKEFPDYYTGLARMEEERREPTHAERDVRRGRPYRLLYGQHGGATRVIAPARRRCAVKPAARMGSWWPMADRAHGYGSWLRVLPKRRCPADRSPRPVDAAVGPAQRADVALPLVQRFVRAGWDREHPAEVVDRFESLASHPVRQVVEEHGCVFGTVP